MDLILPRTRAATRVLHTDPIRIACGLLLASLTAAAGCSDEKRPTPAGGSGGSGGSGGTAGESTGNPQGGGAGEAGAHASASGGSGAMGGASTSSGGASATAGGGASNTTGIATGTGGSAGEGGMLGAGGAAPELACRKGDPCAGYTLIGSPENDAGAEFKALLIDMEGNEVHRWSITGFPPKMLPGGSLIGCTGVFPTSYDCVEMQQVSWDGELEWSFSDWTAMGTATAARHHHDFERDGNPVGFYAPGQDFVPQGNTLVLAHQRKIVPQIRAGQIDDDVIYEVDFNGELTGFEWHAADHFDEFGFDEEAQQDIATRSASVLEWLHGNTVSLVGPNRWYDQGYDEFHPENIIYSARNACFVAIISRETGNVVWRIGPDFAGNPEENLGQIAGQHHPHLVPAGLPGAGNMLIFDNGLGSGYGGPNNSNRYSRNHSRVIEFDPVSLELVWQYGSDSGAERLRSTILSNMQRLPNGNTLITEGVPGRLLEVTPEKQIVWEYQYEGPLGGSTQWVYRSYRIPPEWLPAGVNEAQAGYATWASQFEE